MTPDQSTALAALLATHAPQLRALLPASFWPLVPFEVKEYGPLTKYTLGPDGGEWIHLHHVREADTGPPHCHPTRIDTILLEGSYWERLFLDGTTQDVLREQGSQRIIEPDCIHLLTSLPEGHAWSLVRTGPVVRSWQHYPELVG